MPKPRKSGPKIALVKVPSDTFGNFDGRGRNKKNIVERLQSYPPLGLCYLSAFLKSKEIEEVEIIDCVERQFTACACAGYILKERFDVVGITLTSFSLKNAYNLIRHIRQSGRNIAVVLGGIHVTHHPEIIRVLNADYGIRGDGEESFYELLMNFRADIDGLTYIENGRLNSNVPAKILDLDSLPQPVILKHKYNFPFCGGNIYTMITSRGCPYDCIFCGIPHKGSFRKRSAENVFKEMENLKREGYDYIDFKDDCFSLGKERIIQLCNMIIGNRLNISWGAEVRADTVDFSLLKLMGKAGCHNLKFGIESGSPRIRNEIMQKRLADEAILNFVAWCRELGIKSIAYALFGSPTESLDDMKQTVKFIKILNPDYADFLLSVTIPGSRLYEVALEEKTINENLWEEMVNGNCQPPVYIPKGVAIKDMRKLQSGAYRYFYFNPSKILKGITEKSGFKKMLLRLKFAALLCFGKVAKY